MGHPMGSGKTRIALALAASDASHLLRPTTLVLCPDHLVEQWEAEARTVPGAAQAVPGRAGSAEKRRTGPAQVSSDDNDAPADSSDEAPAPPDKDDSSSPPPVATPKKRQRRDAGW